MISYVVEHNVEGELEAGFVEGNANERKLVLMKIMVKQ